MVAKKKKSFKRKLKVVKWHVVQKAIKPSVFCNQF